MVYCLWLCIYFLWWWSFFAYSVQKIKQNERFFTVEFTREIFRMQEGSPNGANSVKRRKIVSNWDLRPFQFSFSLVKWIFLIWQSRLGSNLKEKNKNYIWNHTSAVCVGCVYIRSDFRPQWPHAVMIIPTGVAKAAVPKDERLSSCNAQ